MSKVILFDSKINCCGCGACMNVCPKKAISMHEDDYGFLYPVINETKCVGCQLCLKSCSYKKNNKGNNSLRIYVASTKNTDIFKSASGGVFASLAKSVIIDGGVVFGATLLFDKDRFIVKHIAIEKVSELEKIQGSKYIQSDIGSTYTQAKELLEKGKLVLFSGTPCQIDGLNNYLNKKYENLILIDIICHGVPNAKFFNDYIKEEDKKIKGKIINFKFREKKYGWKLCGQADYINKKGINKVLRIYPGISSYYNLFLNADIYRENCYECRYAKGERVSDITIGDYWGIQNEHAELLKTNSKEYNLEKGISCMLVNTNKGEHYIEKYKCSLNLYLSRFDKVANKNSQLRTPSKRSEDRLLVLNLYKTNGYKSVENWFVKNQGIKYYIRRIYYFIIKIVKK